MSGLVLALDVRMRYVDADGVPTGGYIGLLNPVSFNIEQAEAERTPRVSKLRDSYGQALDELVTPQPQTISFTTDESGDAEVLAWAMSGQVGNYTQAAGTVSEDEITIVKGEWFKLPHRMISAVELEPAGGGTPYVVDVDYLVDPTAGMIKPRRAARSPAAPWTSATPTPRSPARRSDPARAPASRCASRARARTSRTASPSRSSSGARTSRPAVRSTSPATTGCRPRSPARR